MRGSRTRNSVAVQPQVILITWPILQILLGMLVAPYYRKEFRILQLAGHASV